MSNKPKADLVPLREVGAKLIIPGKALPIGESALRDRCDKLGIVPQRLSLDGSYRLNYVTVEEAKLLELDFTRSQYRKLAKLAKLKKAK